MGLFDNLKNAAAGAVNNVIKEKQDKSETKEIVFDRLPESLEEFKAMPQAALTDPFEVAALTVLAFCAYPSDKETSLAMVDFLKGPQPLSQQEKQFIKDRFMDKDYVPRSYLKGATPANDYVPTEPYTVVVKTNPYSYDNEGYVTLHLTSGGADSPRQIKVRKTKEGKWCLWEQFILVDIRKPESTNPWA